MALPITGSVELLEMLSPFVADDHINEVLHGIEEPAHGANGAGLNYIARYFCCS